MAASVLANFRTLAAPNSAASSSSSPAASSSSSASKTLYASRRKLKCRRGANASSASNGRQSSIRAMSRSINAVAVTEEETLKGYELPTWANFEMGRASVFWETATGEPPKAGGQLTIYFNPAAGELEALTEYGIGFNGGFNQPIMCGGEPRIMARKDRGGGDEPIYSIKINVPEHALTLEFSFTDGLKWDGPYLAEFTVPAKWRNRPKSFFEEGLEAALSVDGACAQAIFPEQTFVQDRCLFPANLIIEGGNRCDLDLVPGCMDPENPFYDPLANINDDSCPYISDGEAES